MLKEIKPFLDYELAETNEDLFVKRLLMEQARAELKKLIEQVDEELIRRMKEQGIKEFSMQTGGGEQKIYYAKKKTEKVIATIRLQEFLLDGEYDERQLARRSLSNNASAWKIAKVRELCDTLGIEQKEIIEIKVEDKLVVKAIPVEKLKGMGIIK